FRLIARTTLMLDAIRTTAAAAALLAASTLTASAQDAPAGFVTAPSAYGVAETLDRLEAILGERGITVAARIDHGANAAGVDLDLPPTQLLVFGNPKLGTPLMQQNILVGLDLPMKVLAYETADGETMIAYTAPGALAERHGLDASEIIATMEGALGNLTGAATSAE
ncbi:MAG: DUF302 domain-containing protein, partial [Pseudomonadota bacterium]